MVKKRTTKKTTKKTSKRVKKVVKKAAVKRTRKKYKCPKCGSKSHDRGSIRVGQIYRSRNLGYKSERHSPYADHVGQEQAVVCVTCGYVEIYFDVHDLKRKVHKS